MTPGIDFNDCVARIGSLPGGSAIVAAPLASLEPLAHPAPRDAASPSKRESRELNRTATSPGTMARLASGSPAGGRITTPLPILLGPRLAGRNTVWIHPSGVLVGAGVGTGGAAEPPPPHAARTMDAAV